MLVIAVAAAVSLISHHLNAGRAGGAAGGSDAARALRNGGMGGDPPAARPALRAGSGQRVYLGLSMFPPDQAVYLSWIEQARQGRTLLGNMWHAGPDHARLPHATFLALGRAARAAGMDSRSVYIAARLPAIALLGVCALLLCAALLEGQLARRLALAWIMLGSGVGLYFIAWNARSGAGLLDELQSRPWCPADVAMPEFTPVVASSNYAHMLFGFALMALAMALLAWARARASVALAAAGGLTALVLGYAHIYDTLVLLAVVSVLGARALRRGDRPRAATAGVFLAAALVPFVHYLTIFLTDPYLRAWSRVPLPSPSPTAYAAGLGAAFVFALLALHRIASGEALTRDDELLATWLVVQSALLYSGPFVQFERRLAEGLWLPFALLASAEVSRRISGAPWRAPALLALACVALPTGLAVHALAGQREPAHDWYFRDADELAAIAKLGEVTGPDAVVLASPAASLLVPGLAGRRVAVGHVDHTPQYTAKAREVARFYHGQLSSDEAHALLEQLGATHVLVTRVDEGPPPPPALLEPVAHLGRHALFCVKR